MAVYRLKRKQFGIIQGIGSTVGNLVGGTMEGAGKVLDSGVGKTAGAIGGAALATSAMPLAASLLVPGAALAAPVVGGLLGWNAAKAGGKVLKSVGESIQD